MFGGRTREWVGGSARDDFWFEDCLVALSLEGGRGARDDSMVYIKSMRRCRKSGHHEMNNYSSRVRPRPHFQSNNTTCAPSPSLSVKQDTYINNMTVTPVTTGQKPKCNYPNCSYKGCDNRAKQDGVCVTHGAKQKMCSFPDCNKAVWMAGFCSTHGPRCAHEGCDNRIKQGGVCVTQGIIHDH